MDGLELEGRTFASPGLSPGGEGAGGNLRGVRKEAREEKISKGREAVCDCPCSTQLSKRNHGKETTAMHQHRICFIQYRFRGRIHHTRRSRTRTQKSNINTLKRAHTCICTDYSKPQALDSG